VLRVFPSLVPGFPLFLEAVRLFVGYLLGDGVLPLDLLFHFEFVSDTFPNSRRVLQLPLMYAGRYDVITGFTAVLIGEPHPVSAFTAISVNTKTHGVPPIQ
jgi:hypothetical protein